MPGKRALRGGQSSSKAAAKPSTGCISCDSALRSAISIVGRQTWRYPPVILDAGRHLLLFDRPTSQVAGTYLRLIYH
jgi:hypothetical protein